MIPFEIAKDLPEGLSPEELEEAILVRTGLSGLLGETLLLRGEAGWAVLARGSPFERFARVPMAAGARPMIEGEGFDAQIVIPAAGRVYRLRPSPFDLEALRKALGRPADSPAPPPPPARPAAPASAAEDRMATVRRIAREQGATWAVQHLVQTTGIDLAAAKRAVGTMRAEARTARPSPGEVESTALQLLRAGRTKSAILYYRAAMRIRYEEARGAVHALAERHGIKLRSSSRKTLAVALFVVVAALAAIVWLAR
jgi:hypothetical protein